ncbi:MAG: molybdenum cofactor carrier [Desulfobulbaceae bacterium]|nr:MAG: molybdenum cofactor carrier [Desulfobulbaceae bacterium]
MLSKIISGGQTGVDQAALDAAISSECAYGGWLPAGRKTEAGPLSTKYQMEVMGSANYADRTKKNVQDADATLIISNGPLTGGSALTERIARDLSKPCMHIDFTQFQGDHSLKQVALWLAAEDVAVLNVAGPRSSSDPGIYQRARSFIEKLLAEGAS